MSSHPSRDDGPRSGSPAPPGRWLEAPWLLGVLVGWAGLLVRGHAFLPMRFPAGHDWFETLPDAWMAWHRIDAGFHPYRSALYPFLLGGLGEHIGYAHAGLLISSLSMGLAVLAAGLGARALAGPWAGAVAAASLPLFNVYAESSRWVNMYPVLAAGFGLALALGARAARWPGPGSAATAGLAAGLALGLDARGLTVWAATAVMILVGATRPLTNRQRALMIAAFFLASIPGPLAARTLALKAPLAASAHSIILRRDAMPMFRNRPELAPVCGAEPLGAPISLEALTRPCAFTLLRYNAAGLDRFLPFGLWGSLALLAASLLPGRHGWRGSLTAAVVLGWLVPLLLLPSLWVVLPDRYLFPVAVPLAMLPPVGLTRALRTLFPARRAVAAGRLAALLAAAWLAWYSVQLLPVERLETHVLWGARGRMFETIQDLVRPGDTLLDCSGMALEAGLLPRRYHADPTNLSGIDRQRCERWLEAPEGAGGTAWIVTGVRCVAPALQSVSNDTGTDRPPTGSAPFSTPAGLDARAAPSGTSTASTGALEPVCHPALVPREARACAHGLEPWRCPRCAFEARAGARWERVYEAVKSPDRDGSLQLWRARAPGSKGPKRAK